MEEQRKAEFLKKQEGFRRNAFRIINQMVKWCNTTPGSRHLVDEILHSIFFLGQILDPNGQLKFSPEEIISDKEILDFLNAEYPCPFQYFKTRLPRRSPFSCVLDMVVLRKKPENENQIRELLAKFVGYLKSDSELEFDESLTYESESKSKSPFLVSSTICVSKSEKGDNYYGLSLSTNGPNAGRVVTGASCLSFWDDNVAGAVMTYYSEKKKQEKKDYFDGTIRVTPAGVSCKAYPVSRNNNELAQETEPCKSCGNLFGLPTDSQREWAYGNCAEVESLSNLFKKEPEVKMKAKPRSGTYTPENIKRAREDVKKVLKETLKMVHFRIWDDCYYPETQES